MQLQAITHYAILPCETPNSVCANYGTETAETSQTLQTVFMIKVFNGWELGTGDVLGCHDDLL